MWYVIGEIIQDSIAWWGAYEKEEEADNIAKMVDGVALKVKDWPAFARIMNKGFDEIKPDEVVM